MKTVEDGIKLSSNAAFAVLHEICRPPYKTNVTADELTMIANYWHKCFTHPLASVVIQAAYSMINNKELPVTEAMEIMNTIAKYQNEYSALAIAYFSCDDIEGKADQLYESIVLNWSSKNR
jgi:hypothetical protein